MRRITRGSILIYTVLTAFLLVTTVLLVSGSADASSHREAPLISKDPFADNTDTYVFVNPNNPANLVLIANYIPFESPEGGPNYFEFDENVLYDIHIDNDGDAIADFTYTLQAQTQLNNPSTFLYNTGPINSISDPTWNRRQTYTVTEYRENGTSIDLVQNVTAPPANIGPKSTPDYPALVQEATYDAFLGGDAIKVFAGPTDDPFWVDLQVFDLLTLRGQGAPIGYSFENLPVDSLSGYNVHSLVIELPISRLTQGGEPVLGVWSTTRRPMMRVLEGPAGLGTQTQSGASVQVSRLGMPLVNEAVLPLALKDAFNSLPPSADLSIYVDPTFGPILQKAVEDPELGNLLCGLYGVPLPGDTNGDCATEFTVGSPRSGRGDIFDIFLTGMVLANPFTIETATGPVELPAGFNVNQPANVVPAEMIRINTTVSGGLCKPEPSRLGVLGGDACGFPNGRRLMDDVVEIELLAVAGAAYEVLDDSDASFSFNPAFIAVLDDGLDTNDVAYLDAFPYLAYAQSGADHEHTGIKSLYMPVIQSAATTVQTVQTAAEEQPIVVTSASLAGAFILSLPALLWHRRRQNDEPLPMLDD